jgi:lysyl endopeptidase
MRQILQRSFFTRAAFVLGSVVSLAASAATVMELTSPVPTSIPEQYRSAPQMAASSQKAAVVERFASSGASDYQIDVGPLKVADVQKFKSTKATSEKGRPLKIGFAREIPAALRTVPLSIVPWQTQSDGSRTFRIELYASEAAGIRIGYRFQGPASGAEIRFAGNGREQIFKSEVAANSEIIWSPTMEGDRGTVELRVLSGFDPNAFQLVFEQLVHLTKVGKALNEKDARDIGASGDCNIDIACVNGNNPSQALREVARAAAKMVFVDGGDAYLCTGTLLNSNPASGVPYFFTAAHCFDSQAAASTLNTYWFFDASTCDSLAVPPYQLVGGGSTLLVRDGTMDVMLLQMNAAPPNGAIFAAWDATVIPTNAVVTGIHHPRGDLKKFSQGNMLGNIRGPQFCNEANTITCSTFLRDSYIAVRWLNGTTEGGSSGSGLFTFDQAGGYYALRGGLEGGEAACNNPGGIDLYSRMDLLFTRLAPYLAPGAIIPVSNSSVSSMVEFFNPEFNFYFITSRENEKGALDTLRDGFANPTWYRTGYWFKVDANPSSSTSSLTRYFIAGAAKNATRGTHFYTALNSDKQLISGTGKERFGAGCNNMPNTFFCNEGTDSYVAQPVNGTGPTATCLTGERPIYRVFRGEPNYRDDGNHRFINNPALYNYMVNDQGWVGENINMCARP